MTLAMGRQADRNFRRYFGDAGSAEDRKDQCFKYSKQSFNISLNIIPDWWFGTWLLFLHILEIIIPTDFHVFRRGRYTTNQITFNIEYR
jgi:hypothetical protein